MNTSAIGLLSEDVAETYLKKQGMKVLARNWRRRACEIDIISEKGKTVYFVEVKFRSNVYQGSGLEYITPKKIKQMKFAAELWSHENDWRGERAILAIAVEHIGETMSVKEVVEVI